MVVSFWTKYMPFLVKLNLELYCRIGLHVSFVNCEEKDYYRVVSV